jgi:hypothetical protein
MSERVAMGRLCYLPADALPGTTSLDRSRLRVVSVQSMSLAQVGYHYEFLPRKLASVHELAHARVALAGAYVGAAPPTLSPAALRFASVVHIGAELAPAA